MTKSSSVIGVDLGGTKIALASYDSATWELLDHRRVSTPANEGFSAVLETLVDAVNDLRTESTVAIGIGVPGLVGNDGVVLTMPNIPGAENVPLQQHLSERLSLPVFVENDANCFTLAEALHGSCKDQTVVVGVTLGTGVGGGIVIDGKIFRGSNGYAGEIGHMLLMPGHPPYESDDKRGDVEQFFSGTALGKRCKQAEKPSDFLEGETCAFLHDNVAEEVAWMCTNLIHVLDPSVIVFGGSTGRALAPHMQDIRKELTQWMLPGTPIPHLEIATLKDAATRGAALLTQT